MEGVRSWAPYGLVKKSFTIHERCISLSPTHLKKIASPAVILILAGLIIIAGMTFKKSTLEVQNNVEVPVVELTTEQKFEEARNAMLKEIETLEAEKAAIEEKIKAKKELIN